MDPIGIRVDPIGIRMGRIVMPADASHLLGSLSPCQRIHVLLESILSSAVPSHPFPALSMYRGAASSLTTIVCHHA